MGNIQDDLRIEDISEEDWSSHQKTVVPTDPDSPNATKESDSPAQTRNYNTNANKAFMGKEYNWLGLEVNKDVVFRPLGLPVDSRKKSWHPKKIFIMDFIGDNNQYIPMIFRQEKNHEGVDQNVVDENWIIKKLLNKVFSKRWNKNKKHPTKDELGAYDYDYEGTEIFRRLKENRPNPDWDTRSLDVKNIPERVAMNVISRMDDINFKTGRTSILAPSFQVSKTADKKGKKDKDGNPLVYTNYKFNYGISDSLYKALVTSLVEAYSHWDLDAIVKTTLANAKSNLPTYTIGSSADVGLTEEVQMLLVTRPKIESIPVMKNGKEIFKQDVKSVPLTAEEKKIVPYSLDELFAPTTYQDIFDGLEDTLRLCDKELGTTFLDELIQELKNENGITLRSKFKRSYLVVKENKEAPSGENSLPSQNSSTVNESETKKTEAPQSLPPSTEGATDLPVMSLEEVEAMCEKVYDSWQDLPQEEKDKMLNNILTFDDGIPVLKDSKLFLKCTCSRKMKKISDGTMTNVNVSCHKTSEQCPMCATTF